MKHPHFNVDRDTPDGKLDHQFAIRLTENEVTFLDAMVAEGGYASRAQLMRSLVREIIRDEQKA